jgi:hypothetical protein
MAGHMLADILAEVVSGNVKSCFLTIKLAD